MNDFQRTGSALADSTDQIAASAEHYLDHFLPFHLHRVMAHATQMANTDYRPDGITVPEARLLMTLLLSPDLPAGRLSELLCVERSLMSHMMRDLAAKQLITRTRDEANRRIIRVSLTDKGRAQAEKCRQLAAGHERRLVKGLSARERLTLRDLLDRMYENIR